MRFVLAGTGTGDTRSPRRRRGRRRDGGRRVRRSGPDGRLVQSSVAWFRAIVTLAAVTRLMKKHVF